MYLQAYKFKNKCESVCKQPVLMNVLLSHVDIGARGVSFKLGRTGNAHCASSSVDGVFWY